MFTSRMSHINHALTILRFSPQVTHANYLMQYKNSIPVYYLSFQLNIDITLAHAKDTLANVKDVVEELLDQEVRLVSYAYDTELMVLSVKFAF